MAAAASGNLCAAEHFLSARKANPLVVCAKFKTAIDYAREKADESILNLINDFM